MACSICEAFQPRVKETRLGRATRASSASSMAGLSTALGAPEPLLHDLSQDPLRDIPDVQAPRSHSPSLQGEGGVQAGWEEASQLAQEDTLSIAASGEGASFSSDMQVGEIPAEEEPGFEVASEASATPLSSLAAALMGRAAAFLQVPWTSAAEPRRSVFRTQAMAPRPQKFLAFSDFLEKVRSSWDRPASAPSMRKQAALLAFLEGTDKLGLSGFPPVDSTIVNAPPVGGLAICPNPQCRVTETHLRRAYAAEAQETRLSNTASVRTAYLDGVMRETPLPMPVAMELHLLSSTLLQISGLQGQALGRSLASLVVARRQLWLSQARVPDADKAALLDAPISPGHTFGPAVEEILQRSHREREASWQEAALLPPRASAWGRSSLWRAPQMWTVTGTVPIPTAPLGDLRHCLHDTPAASNRAQPTVNTPASQEAFSGPAP
ncbi:UNVERIFIED_CONTAM: hypothetical protein FKN15_021518 [Acipenser sinensis]